MALDLSGLTAYTEEFTDGILQTALQSSRFLPYVTTWENVKSSIKLPNLESTVPYQAGSSCNSVTTSGTTTVTQDTLSTNPIEFAETICVQDLEPYFTQKWLPKGAKPDTAKIMQDIISRKMAKVALQNEIMAFQGKTTYTNSTILKQINGAIATVDTAGTAIAATASTFNKTNAIAIINEIAYQKIPSAEFANEPIIAISEENFRLWQQAINEANAYNYWVRPADLKQWEAMVPGTNTKVVAFAGMNNDNAVDTGSLPTAVKNRILTFSKQQFNWGVDLSSDSTSTEVWYEKKERKIYIYGRFRAGVAMRQINKMVQYTNT